MNLASDHECGSDSVTVDTLGRCYSVKPGPKPSGYVGPRVRVSLSALEWQIARSIASEEETTIADILREGLHLYARRRQRV